jgi:hypothetical protein
MNKTILLAISGFCLTIIGVGLIILAMVFSYNNAAVNAEAGIVASYNQSENVLGQLAPKLKEALGVTSIQTDALEKIIKGANESRYGSDGSKATVQWIKEQNPTLDQSGYSRVISMIESGRNDFAREQKMKTDRIRDYRTMTSSMPGKFFYTMLGFPTPGFFDKYEKNVVSSHADNAFKTGIDDGVNLKQ